MVGYGTGNIGLVLSGGGARGAYQAGAIRALAELSGDQLSIPIVTGVSAGAINAAFVASDPGPISATAERLQTAWHGLTLENVFLLKSSGLTKTMLRWLWMLGTGRESQRLEVEGLLDTRPLRQYLMRHADLEGIRRNLQSGRLLAFSLTTTSYSTGLTVNFVECDQPDIEWKRAGRRGVRTRIDFSHIMASSALPLIFPAIPIGNSYYGDGSIRLQTPLAPAIHLGADKLIAISVRYNRSEAESAQLQVEGYPPPAQIIGMLMNGVFLDALETDMERVRRINRTLKLLPPGTHHPAGLKQIDLLVLRPSMDLGKLASDLNPELPRLLKVIVKGLGTQRSRAPDFLSYLLFEHSYVQRLIELGYTDTLERRDELEAFLARPSGSAGESR